MNTLYEEVTNWMHAQQVKHDLGADYVERTVNDKSQYEFLQAISEGLDLVLASHDKKIADLTRKLAQLERASTYQSHDSHIA